MSFWFSSLLTSLMNNPLDSCAMKYRLHEFIVLPGRRSIATLESMPSSGRNLSCCWVLHKISLLVGGGDGCRCCSGCSIGGNESESLSAKRRNIKMRSKSSRDWIVDVFEKWNPLLDHLTANHRLAPQFQAAKFEVTQMNRC